MPLVNKEQRGMDGDHLLIIGNELDLIALGQYIFRIRINIMYQVCANKHKTLEIL